MNSFQTLLLGVVQGLTEFLPVSSSGHLVVFQHLLGFGEPELLLDTTLHLGTLVAVFIYFRADIARMLREVWPPRAAALRASLLGWVLAGSVPTAFIGLAFREPLEKAFASTEAVGGLLMVTGLIVAATRLIPQGHGSRDRVGLLTALAIGTAQGVAILPGISRSGTTIACGLLLGLQRELAGRFSFLLAIPAMAGAMVLQLDTAELSRVGPGPLIVGFTSAALTGLLALRWLMRLLRRGALFYFAPYCWLLGLTVLLW